VRQGDWKLIVTPGANGEKVELFNLSSDPGETNDLASSQPDRVATLRRVLAEVSSTDRDAVAKDGR
jgi:arylsulfatase